MTLYELKPRFQGRLRPLAARLAKAGVTANQVTVAACLGSLLVGGSVLWFSGHRAVFLLLPVWLFVRMALNAVDGMLAREHGQASRLGAVLNEVGDVVSDAALFLPFGAVAPFGFGSVGLLAFLAALTEFCGILGPSIGGARRYDGPFGKSDRALACGALATWIGSGGGLAPQAIWLVPVAGLLLALTCVNRIRAALAAVPTQTDVALSAGAPAMAPSGPDSPCE